MDSRKGLLEAERVTQEKLAAISSRKVNEYNEAERVREGLQHRNTKVEDASWADMFRGEEITNFDTIELAKVQMFFITAVTMLIYIVLLLKMFSGDVEPDKILQFPDVSEGLDWLFAVSHAGYVTGKAAQQPKK